MTAILPGVAKLSAAPLNRHRLRPKPNIQKSAKAEGSPGVVKVTGASAKFGGAHFSMDVSARVGEIRGCDLAICLSRLTAHASSSR